MERERLISLAHGEQEADLLIRNCRLVDVLAGRVHPAEVAVSGGVVVGVEGGYGARQTVDLGGRYLAPGLMDAHVHLESSMVAPGQFARAVVPRGTTAVVTDCHEIANVLGLDGILFMIESAKRLPLDVWVMLPPCVPATPLEHAGAVLEAADLARLADHPSVKGLGELMNFPGTIGRDPGVMAKLALFEGRPVEGHAPEVSGKDLAAYVAAGPDSEHECVSAAEAEEKLRNGMFIFMREGTSARNLKDLLPVMNSNNSYRCCLCTDDRHPADLLERGHIDSLLRMAVEAGVSPVTAIQMATIHPQRRLGFSRRGAIAPGFVADMVAFDDLEEFRAAMVFKDGVMVAMDGALNKEPDAGPGAPSTFNVKGFGADRLRIAVEGGRGEATARVIGVVADQIVTEPLTAAVKVVEGSAAIDVDSDLLKIAVVERHNGTGDVGVGFVRGFGLRSGAIASSVAHDSHNIVVVGCSDDDMVAAVERIVAMGGGQVAVSGGKALAEVALPIAGLMSEKPVVEVASLVEGLNGAASGLGCVLSDPCMTMSFLALPVIPSLKMTDMGLVDVEKFQVVPVLA